MTYEFEGRTEKEAIDKAAEELGLEKDRFDVEILETQRSGLFKKGFVRIRVHTDKPAQRDSFSASGGIPGGDEASFERASASGGTSTRTALERRSPPALGNPAADNDFEQKMIDYVENLAGHMGCQATVSILFREERKLGLKIDSDSSPILIGKKGKTLDAMQLLANIYAGRQGREDMRIILDSENYRIRREESLVRLAYTVADRVRESRTSILLEPMNPFDRRLIHTTLNDISDVETRSEGEGLIKQVRVYYRGAMR
ncbi:MAG: protein jag [Spirochaetaceae bacterium]|jgi:spoIIIJ-associated protein|nr:protein jag [Spirochaetaceae bacterium]